MIDLTLTIPLSAAQRETYGKIADVLICRTDQMPSATDVGVHDRWIDEALRLRPDLRDALEVAIAYVDAQDDVRSALEALATGEPETFAAVGNLTAGSYYMDDRVRELMGYPGQEERRLTDDVDQYLELLENVVERGPVYRATPA